MERREGSARRSGPTSLRRRLVLVWTLLLTLLLAGSASADDSPTAAPAPDQPQESEVQLQQDITDVNKQLDELDKDLRGLADKKEEAQKKQDAQSKDLRELVAQVNDDAAAVSKLDCKGQADASKAYNSLVGDVFRISNWLRAQANSSSYSDRVSKIVSDLDNQSGAIDPNGQFGKPPCAKVVAALQSSNLQSGLKSVVDDFVASAKTPVDDAEKKTADAKAQVELLKKKRGLLLEQLNKLQHSGWDATKGTTMIVVALGLFSLAIMVMVQRFRVPIQLVWVRSGQVIQFMTVTSLIIVVLVLGLAHILREEALGTILGTIGGYVLSQGKRSFARRRRARPPSDADDEPPAPHGNEETESKAPEPPHPPAPTTAIEPAAPTTTHEAAAPAAATTPKGTP